MHSNIIQISVDPITVGEFITSDLSIPDYQKSQMGIDYIGTPLTDDRIFDTLSSFLPKGIFTIDRSLRTIKVNQDPSCYSSYYDNWFRNIRTEIDRFPDGFSYDRLSRIVTRGDNSLVIFFERCAEFLPEFIDEMRTDYRCRTLYIGGGLEFHF